MGGDEGREGCRPPEGDEGHEEVKSLIFVGKKARGTRSGAHPGRYSGVSIRRWVSAATPKGRGEALEPQLHMRRPYQMPRFWRLCSGMFSASDSAKKKKKKKKKYSALIPDTNSYVLVYLEKEKF